MATVLLMTLVLLCSCGNVHSAFRPYYQYAVVFVQLDESERNLGYLYMGCWYDPCVIMYDSPVGDGSINIPRFKVAERYFDVMTPNDTYTMVLSSQEAMTIIAGTRSHTRFHDMYNVYPIQNADRAFTLAAPPGTKFIVLVSYLRVKISMHYNYYGSTEDIYIQLDIKRYKPAVFNLPNVRFHGIALFGNRPFTVYYGTTRIQGNSPSNQITGRRFVIFKPTEFGSAMVSSWDKAYVNWFGDQDGRVWFKAHPRTSRDYHEITGSWRALYLSSTRHVIVSVQYKRDESGDFSSTTLLPSNTYDPVTIVRMPYWTSKIEEFDRRFCLITEEKNVNKILVNGTLASTFLQPYPMTEVGPKTMWSDIPHNSTLVITPTYKFFDRRYNVRIGIILYGSTRNGTYFIGIGRGKDYTPEEYPKEIVTPRHSSTTGKSNVTEMEVTGRTSRLVVISILIIPVLALFIGYSTWKFKKLAKRKVSQIRNSLFGSWTHERIKAEEGEEEFEDDEKSHYGAYGEEV